MKRNIVVTDSKERWIEDLPVEIVERKGLGHPDSLCDGIAERISVEYTRWCRQHVGRPLHHNFDKVQLVAGAVSVGFGGGEMLKPIRIQIAGRGTPTTPDGRAVPVDMLAIEAAKAHVRETLRYLNPDRHCVVDCFAGQGASALVHTVEQVTANDTSVGVAYWPLSDLERIVLDATHALNHVLLDEFPIGEDVKVMGVRLGNELILTCAVPFMAPEIKNLRQYLAAKEALQSAVKRHAQKASGRPVVVHVNTADDAEAGDVYLTLTGTSGECGDDGAVGRGNRVTGLITPFRPVSLEAAAGKNPVGHVGKLYNALALQAAQVLVEQVAAVRQAQVVILSQIGRPLDQPLVATATVQLTDASLTAAVRQEIEALLDDQLAHIDRVRQKIMRGEMSLF